jgi:hypothetical protein
VAADRNMWIREQLYFARNTLSRVSAVVLGMTYIYIKLMNSSVKDIRFGNDFILFSQKFVGMELSCPFFRTIAVDIGVV